MAVAFEKPLLVVTLDEAPDDLVGLFQRFEIVKIQTLFFQRANPTFHHTVALRLTDVGRVHVAEKTVGDFRIDWKRPGVGGRRYSGPYS